MLTAAFHIIRDSVMYCDLGAYHFTKRDPAKAAKRLLKRLEGLGYAVEAHPVSALVSREHGFVRTRRRVAAGKQR